MDLARRLRSELRFPYLLRSLSSSLRVDTSKQSIVIIQNVGAIEP